MDIESIIRRKDGTHVTLGNIEYHFRPDPAYDGAHVAAVEDPDHIGRFLGIREGYRAARKAGSQADAEIAASISIPRPTTIDTLNLPDAPPAPAERTEPDDDPIQQRKPDGALTADEIDAMEMDEAAALFERLEGRKPPRVIKIEALREKLKEIALT